MFPKYSKINTTGNGAKVTLKTASAIEQILPTILHKSLSKAAAAAQKRASRFSILAQQAETEHQKAMYLEKARKAEEIATKMREAAQERKD